MTGKPLVFVSMRLDPREKAIVEDVLTPLSEVAYLGSGDDPYRGVEKAVAIIAFSLPLHVIERAVNLKFVQSPAAGVDRLNVEELTRRGIKVASSKGCNAAAVAEHVFALILALAKKVVEQDSEMKEGVWRGYTKETMLLDLEGSTVGVIGYGNIGREVAKRAKAFGMKVLGVRRRPKPDPYADFMGGPSDMLRVLAESDFVVVCLPLTRETRGAIGERELRAMKKTAFLIHVSRGPVVDEEALYRALTEGWIAGAGIDVWWAYPPEEGAPSPLGIHRLPNVVATPHKAGWTRRAREKCLRFATENVARFLRGEEPLNLVSPLTGY